MPIILLRHRKSTLLSFVCCLLVITNVSLSYRSELRTQNKYSAIIAQMLSLRFDQTRLDSRAKVANINLKINHFCLNFFLNLINNCEFLF